METTRRYVAFLRGINVGGNKKVPMSELGRTLEKNGLENVKTILASGNVIFETKEKNSSSLAKNIHKILKEKFNFEIPVLLRRFEEIKQIVESDPFKGIKTSQQTKLYVTFLAEVAKNSKSDLKIPFETPEKDFKIIAVSDLEVYSVLYLSEGRNTTDLMGIIEKEFGLPDGKNVTTRNWNTIVKVGSL